MGCPDIHIPMYKGKQSILIKKKKKPWLIGRDFNKQVLNIYN